MAALDPVILLARDIAAGRGDPGTANRDAAVLGVDVDVVAGQAGQFRGEYELVRRLVQIDRRSPARRVAADQLTELFVQREQVAQRIPAREGHVSHRSICATISRIYR